MMEDDEAGPSDQVFLMVFQFLMFCLHLLSPI